MRFHNIWFDGVSFLVAILMVVYVVFSVTDKNASLAGIATVSCLFVVIASLYLWMSLRVGAKQKEARQAKKKECRNSITDTDTDIRRKSSLEKNRSKEIGPSAN